MKLGRFETNECYQGDCRKLMREIPDNSIHCCITSPPYFNLRNYKAEPLIWGGSGECEHEWKNETYAVLGSNVLWRPENDTGLLSLPSKDGKWEKTIKGGEDRRKTTKVGVKCNKCGAWKGSLGLEPDPKMYIENLKEIFTEVRRVLRKDGTCFVVIGDNHGDKTMSKSLLLIPFRFALAMQETGWFIRNVIIWHKPNCMPASAKDRYTIDFEYIFFMAKSKNYFFEQQFEPLAESTIPRMSRGIFENNKWVKGADGQTPHNLSKPRPNIRKMQGTKYGGDGGGLHDHSGYYDGKGNPRFYIMPPIGGIKKAGGDNPVYSGNQPEWIYKDGIPVRNKRCVWKMPTSQLSQIAGVDHFAAFPESLVKIMAASGTSNAGCCSNCGKPYRKIIETKALKRKRKNDTTNKNSVPNTVAGNMIKVMGYTPTCGCNAEVEPCIVFDPFMGSGTVGKVAEDMGRAWLGSELNPEYMKMVKERTRQQGMKLL